MTEPKPTGGTENPHAPRESDTSPASHPDSGVKEPLDFQAIWDAKFAPEVNRVITARDRAQLQRIEAMLDARIPKDAAPEDTSAPHSDDSAKPDKRDLEVQALQRKVAEMERRAEVEANQKKRIERDAAFLRASTAAGTHRPADFAAVLKNSAAVQDGKDGILYAVDENGGHQTLEEYAKALVAADPFWQAPSGKGGSGGPAPTAKPTTGTRPGKTVSRDDHRAKIKELSSDQSELARYIEQVQSGTIFVQRE